MLTQELLLAYVGQLETEGKSHRDIASQIKPLLCMIGNMPVAAITSETVEEYRRARSAQRTRLGTPPSQTTINRELQYLHAAMRRAQRAGRLEKVPWVRLSPEHGRRRDWCREETLARLLEYLRPRQSVLADLVEFYFLTGWRRREALELIWDEVDFEQEAIVITDPRRTKARKGRVFPLEGALHALIWRRWAAKAPGCPWVFHRGGRPVRDFKRAWRKAREACGCPDLSIHGFRRTFATYQTLAGTPEAVIMRLAGWSTASTLRRYQIVDQRALRDAVRQSSSYLKWARSQGRGKKILKSPLT